LAKPKRQELVERFVNVYLRFNRYFTIPNFIPHDPSVISKSREGIRVIGSYSEIDTLAVRMPYSQEQIDRLNIPQDGRLLDGARNHIDFVLAEAKSGSARAGHGPSPNKIWTKKNRDAIAYIVRYLGFFSPNSTEFQKAVDDLRDHYTFEADSVRIRLIVFASTPNATYQARGVQYITFAEMIDFFICDLGISWICADIASKSAHEPWDEFTRLIFSIANDMKIDIADRERELLKYLEQDITRFIKSYGNEDAEDRV
jgi:hypothetical protein